MKCDHYWPFTDEPVMYGEISVEMLSESESPEWTIRKFRLGYVSTSLSTSGSRAVVGSELQAHYQPLEAALTNCVFCDVWSLSLQADESQDVLHLNYTSWPDHGVPTVNAIESILQFVYIVRQQANRTKDPIIVHCRSGWSPQQKLQKDLSFVRWPH